MIRSMLSMIAIAIALSLTMLAGGARAQGEAQCYYYGTYTANGVSDPPSCPPGEAKWTYQGEALLCVNGMPQGGPKETTCALDRTEAGIPFLGCVGCQGECQPLGSMDGPHFASACGGDEEGAPAAGKAPLCDEEEECSSDGRSDGSGLVGDPVDLTTGAMSLHHVDIDLGGGLRFARYYASNRPTATTASTSLPLGQRWTHSLLWQMKRSTEGGRSTIIVQEPFGQRIVFFQDDQGVYRTANLDEGSLSVDSGTQLAIYTSSSGVKVTFNNATPTNEATRIDFPNELPIDVITTSTAVTYTRIPHSIVITRNTGGRVANVKAFRDTTEGPMELESWSYLPTSGLSSLTSVMGPDPSTSDLSDRTTWTFTYSGGSLLSKVERHTTATGASNKVTLGEWFYTAGRVTTVNEQALAQPLKISYSIPATGEFHAEVKVTPDPLEPDPDKSVAKFVSVSGTDTLRNGTLLRVESGVGPVAGAPGVDVDFVAQTTIDSGSPLINVRTDKRGNKTLHQGYNDHGQPTTTVEGWVDNPAAPNGVFGGDDEFEAMRDVTSWHPAIRRPLIVQSPSVLPGGGQRVTTYDYDDPTDPNDTASANEAPTTRLHRRIESGYTLNASGAVIQLGSPYITTYLYDAAGRLEFESGPRPENYTQHVYDPTTGFRTATRRFVNGPGSAVLETGYSDFDNYGNPKEITDPNGNVTLISYDEAKRPKTVTPPFAGGGSTITFKYDIDGNVETVQFPLDSFNQPYALEMRYDTKKRLTHIYDSSGNAIVYERRYDGLVTRETTHSGFVNLASPGTIKSDATFEYDLSGRLIAALNPLVPGNQATYSPDANGNLQSTTDENGKVDTRIFDALDRLEQLSQVRGGTTFVTGFDYDFNGNLKRVTDPAARDTLYQYDDFERLVKTTSPNQGETLYLYDAAGNLTTKIEDLGGASRTTTYAYDGLNRLTGIILPTSAPWVFTYDTNPALNQMGRLASVTNGVVTTEREYYPRGDLKLERTTIGGTSYLVQYGYDAAGNRTSVQAPSGTTSAYAYSGARPRTITVDTPGGTQQIVRNIAFDPFGGRTRAEFPPYDSGTSLNTVISTRSYNERGQVESVLVTSPAGDVINRTFDYARMTGGVGPTDPGRNLDEIIDHRDGSLSRFFFYDSLDRLQKSAQISGASLHQYGYDANGNRTSENAGGTVSGVTYEPGTDRVAATGFSYGFGSIVTYFHHDAYGNRIWQGLLAPYSGQPMFYYDDQNQLVEYRHWWNLSIPVAQYTYDAFGRRVRKIASGATTLYFHDSAGHLIEERILATNATRNYVWLEDEPVGIVDSGAPPKYSWIHTDYLGMPIEVTDTPASGNAQTIWRANYAPYGLAGVFPDPDENGQPFALNLRFPGQYYDAESSFHYNWHRYYDPSIGRYISADPIGQVVEVFARGADSRGFSPLESMSDAHSSNRLNLYQYARNNPTGFSDVLGLLDEVVEEMGQGHTELCRRRTEECDPTKACFDQGVCDAKVARCVVADSVKGFGGIATSLPAPGIPTRMAPRNAFRIFNDFANAVGSFVTNLVGGDGEPGRDSECEDCGGDS